MLLKPPCFTQSVPFMAWDGPRPRSHLVNCPIKGSLQASPLLVTPVSQVPSEFQSMLSVHIQHGIRSDSLVCHSDKCDLHIYIFICTVLFMQNFFIYNTQIYIHIYIYKRIIVSSLSLSTHTHTHTSLDSPIFKSLEIDDILNLKTSILVLFLS